MKILFVNPSLRPGSDHVFLPVGLGYVMTFVKKHGYNFDLLDIDVGNYSNDYVEKYFIKNKFDVRKMIIDIASLIYNQRNILKELKMTPPPMNFMKDWLSEPGEGKEEEERSQN